jgi:hypothetical protein
MLVACTKAVKILSNVSWRYGFESLSMLSHVAKKAAHSMRVLSHDRFSVPLILEILLQPIKPETVI